ncbi:hypothetical protein [Roseimaritima ulvae]|uniref:Glutamine cyclotransferase n=1 Tax=Roseimaritima ulvae TaxID=980254 RepID=A0A5B9R1S6_9BACT|nr:hypothetical protein [Roseimaritima ulvae]QEG43765.1 hypothetical protein UC8_58200 [Roseimaritima ulvae]
MNRIARSAALAVLVLVISPLAADEPDAKRDDPQPPQTYRSSLQLPGLATPESVLLERHRLAKGAAGQGVALSDRFYFTSTSSSICKYDRDWNLLQEQPIRIPGVNHLGAIHHHDGFLWAGLLHGPENGKHDPKLNRSVIAKIRASDLSVVATWDITSDLDWIDPVCFDGQRLWVGDLHDLGIHCYRLDADQLKHIGTFRYPKALSFSQGIRIVGGKLYSIHTFGSMDGLFEFDLPERLSEEPQSPRRVWHIDEPLMHLEGFDFIPGQPQQIWTAQGREVHRYELNQIAAGRQEDQS